MQRERKLAVLRRILGEPTSVGNEYSFFCKLPKPKGCAGEHHKKKLQVNIVNDKWHCWVCDQGGGNLLRLFALGGKDSADYKEYAAEVDKPREVVAKEYDVVRLPREFRALSEAAETLPYRQAIGYLTNRGITSDDILLYRLGHCGSGFFQDRIIIPSFDEYGELNFWVGRTIWETVTPPYLSGKYDKNIIWNSLLVDWTKPITLVEGPFDAIKAGTNAIALQGKYMSQRLKDKLVEARVPVNVGLDSDALEKSLRIIGELQALGLDTRLVTWPGKDAGELSHEQAEEAIANARPVETKVDLLRLKAQYSGTT